MTDVEKLFAEQMDRRNFNRVMNEDFSFIDKLIDQSDIDRLNKSKEDK